MFIQTEATPNPATLKFLPGRPVLPDGVLDIPEPEEAGKVAARGTPVRHSRDHRRILRQRFHHRHQGGWRLAACQARHPRRRHGAFHVRRADPRGRGALEAAADEFFETKDAETVATIKELIETRVRPAVANDGGDITFRGFKDGIVYLNMKGSCSGCPSSTATLKHGIQNLLRHFVPDVVEVRPV